MWRPTLPWNSYGNFGHLNILSLSSSLFIPSTNISRAPAKRKVRLEMRALIKINKTWALPLRQESSRRGNHEELMKMSESCSRNLSAVRVGRRDNLRKLEKDWEGYIWVVSWRASNSSSRWRRETIPGRRNCICKGPEAWQRTVYWSNGKFFMASIQVAFPRGYCKVADCKGCGTDTEEEGERPWGRSV